MCVRGFSLSSIPEFLDLKFSGTPLSEVFKLRTENWRLRAEREILRAEKMVLRAEKDSERTKIDTCKFEGKGVGVSAVEPESELQNQTNMSCQTPGGPPCFDIYVAYEIYVAQCQHPRRLLFGELA